MKDAKEKYKKKGSRSIKLKKNFVKNKIWNISVDPGGNKITGVSSVKTPNGELQVFKHSTDQYHHDNRINEKNFLMKSYYEDCINKPRNEKVKKLSFKVSSTDALLNYICTYASYEDIEHNNEIYLNKSS